MDQSETDLWQFVTNSVADIIAPDEAGQFLTSGDHLKFITQEVLSKPFHLYWGSQTEPPCRSQAWLVSTNQFKVLQNQV